MTSKEITTEKIEAWKKQHGEIYSVTVDDKIGFLKKPDRKALGAAAVIGHNNSIKYNEGLLNNCWLGGDEELRENDAYFLGVSNQLAQIIEIKEVELKKL